MHAFGVHWLLDRCKKPRTGRGFLQIGEGQSEKIPTRYGFFHRLSNKKEPFGSFLLCYGILKNRLPFSRVIRAASSVEMPLILPMHSATFHTLEESFRSRRKGSGVR